MNQVIAGALTLALALGACYAPGSLPSAHEIPVTPSSPQIAAQVVTSTPDPIPPPTSQWVDAGNNGVAGIQFQPVKSDGINTQFWMRIVFNEAQPTGDKIQVLFQDANCQQGTYYTRYLVRFDSNQQLLSEGVPPDANQIVTVDPDSLAGTAFQLSCASHQ